MKFHKLFTFHRYFYAFLDWLLVSFLFSSKMCFNRRQISWVSAFFLLRTVVDEISPTDQDTPRKQCYRKNAQLIPDSDWTTFRPSFYSHFDYPAFRSPKIRGSTGFLPFFNNFQYKTRTNSRIECFVFKRWRQSNTKINSTPARARKTFMNSVRILWDQSEREGCGKYYDERAP